MKLFSILLVAVSVAGVSCERHEFEGPDGTKQLSQHHTAAGAHDEHKVEPAEHAEKKEH